MTRKIRTARAIARIATHPRARMAGDMVLIAGLGYAAYLL
jgi:hypothetical protein